MDCKYNVERIPDTAEIEVLPEGVCPVDWAKKCIDTAYTENCGKSVMCRDGMTQLHMIVGDIVSGKGMGDDIDLVREICELMASTEGCELSVKVAKNVLFTLDKYADAWDQHCRRKRCAALACKAYYSVYCAPDKCQGCTKCMEVCPVGAIAGGKGLICVVDVSKCVRCGKCFEVCPHEARAKYGAGALKPKMPEAPVPVGSFAAAGGAGARRSRRRDI